MKPISLCIIDTDSEYANTFARIVALDYKGINISVVIIDFERSPSIDLEEIPENDIYLVSENIGMVEAFIEKNISKIVFLCDNKVCSDKEVTRVFRFDGVNHIMNLVRNFFFNNRLNRVSHSHQNSIELPKTSFNFPMLNDENLILSFSISGGVGLSSSAIGIGRELSRYRNKKTMYLSLENFENSYLCTSSLHNSISGEEFLYKYYRASKNGFDEETTDMLIRLAISTDEYGLFRFKPDIGSNSMSSLDINSLSEILSVLENSLKLDVIIIDVGTRVDILKRIIEVFTPICIFLTEEDSGEFAMEMLDYLTEDYVTKRHVFSMPNCHDEVIKNGKNIEISLSNEFGFAIKGICDKISEGRNELSYD